VAQGRADWGMTIASVARQHALGFLPVQDEQYDFAVPKSRRERPAVRRFVELLQDPAVRAALTALGFTPS
jgi:putative molybdopterin biosynthesis protein